jgi:ethanolamine utilization protein EutN
MLLGKVIGTVVPSAVYEGLEGVKLLWVQPIDSSGKAAGKALIACDSQQSGEGETVYWVDGREAALALPVHFTPVDASIVGIVDRVDAE